MSQATLEIAPLLDGGRRIAVGCEHGTTYGGDLRTAPLNESAIVATILRRHRLGTGCRCARELERQYPAQLIPANLMVAEVLP